MHTAYLIQQFASEGGTGPARVTEMASRWLAGRQGHASMLTLHEKRPINERYGV